MIIIKVKQLWNIGVTSNRLENATPDVFGTFLNVHEWDVVGD